MQVANRRDERFSQCDAFVVLIPGVSKFLQCLQQDKRLVKRKGTDRVFQEQFVDFRRERSKRDIPIGRHVKHRVILYAVPAEDLCCQLRYVIRMAYQSIGVDIPIHLYAAGQVRHGRGFNSNGRHTELLALDDGRPRAAKRIQDALR